MIKKGRSATNDSQEGLPVRFQRLKYEGKTCIEEFVDSYIQIAIEIVERIRHDKLNHHTNYKLYYAFQDILPKPKDIASEALKDFASKIRKGIEIKSSQLWEKLRETIYRKKFSFKGKKVGITTSLGVVGISSDEITKIVDTNIIIKLADEALFTAKSTGKNRVEITQFKDLDQTGLPS